MGHRDQNRLTGAVPEYVQRPTPVLLVNPDGSPQVPLEIPRRRDDTDDSGVQQRRMSAHQNACWLDKNGPGFRLAEKVDRQHTVQVRMLTGLGILVFLAGMLGGPLVTDWLRSKHATPDGMIVRSAQAGQVDAGAPQR